MFISEKKEPRLEVSITKHKVDNVDWYQGLLKDTNNSGSHSSYHVVHTDECVGNFYGDLELLKTVLLEKGTNYLFKVKATERKYTDKLIEELNIAQNEIRINK